MNATLKSTRVKETWETAPYSAGVLLCEVLEAVEVLENHVRLDDNGWKDPVLAVSSLADHVKRIRQQALNEKLVRSLDGEDGTCGQLSVGAALMHSDRVVYDAQHPNRALS